MNFPGPKPSAWIKKNKNSLGQNSLGLASRALKVYSIIMSIRKVNFVPGEYYHIYNRGNSKQKIYFDEHDYQRFVDLLYAVNTEDRFNFSDSIKGISVYERITKDKLVSIGAYCLMPNHFHILVTPLSEDGLSKFMQKLSTAYAMYFNKKNIRTGSIFEGKFKAEHLNNDIYLKYIFSYIHMSVGSRLMTG